MALYLIDKKYADLSLELALKDESSKVVLVQDGVYLDLSALEGKEIYYIEEDAKSRGVKNLPEAYKKISYEELIDLMVAEAVYNFI